LLLFYISLCMAQEKIILGVDPGTVVMGYGVLKAEDQKLTVLQYGVIHLSKYDDHALRLKKIFERIDTIIDEFMPDEMALEAPFYGKNVQAMLKLGRAQGVAMITALRREIPITEYAPKKVKQSVTGSGNASKEQVAQMLIRQLNIENLPEFLDATDALAVAMCHFYHSRISSGSGGTKKGWKSFLAENPHRIK
jgi:crossover junction endodeoxyribonuclease RuvC